MAQQRVPLIYKIAGGRDDDLLPSDKRIISAARPLGEAFQSGFLPGKKGGERVKKSKVRITKKQFHGFVAAIISSSSSAFVVFFVVVSLMLIDAVACLNELPSLCVQLKSFAASVGHRCSPLFLSALGLPLNGCFRGKEIHFKSFGHNP